MHSIDIQYGVRVRAPKSLNHLIVVVGENHLHAAIWPRPASPSAFVWLPSDVSWIYAAQREERRCGCLMRWS